MTVDPAVGWQGQGDGHRRTGSLTAFHAGFAQNEAPGRYVGPKSEGWGRVAPPTNVMFNIGRESQIESEPEEKLP